MSAPLPPPTGFNCSYCDFGSNSPIPLCPKCGAAQTPAVKSARKANLFGRILSAAGLFIAALANIATLYISFGFYQSAAITPAGTSIRPMGLAVFYFAVGLATPVLALPLSSLGAALCRKTQDEKAAVLAQVGLTLSLTPLPLGLGLFYLITALFGLKLSE